MQDENDFNNHIAVAAAAAVGVEPDDPIFRASFRKKDPSSLRSRRRRRILQSSRSSVVKMARNKFEQDEADVLNIYAKVNGGELLGASGSYGGIFIYFLNDFNTNMVRFNHNILYDVMLKKFRFLIK